MNQKLHPNIIKLQKSTEAMRHLHAAVKALEAAKAQGGYFSVDFAEIASQIKQVISCDHGEAGLEPVIRMLQDQVRK